jgi:hypothetical protein
MELLRRILETDPDIKRFNVLAFNVGAAWLEPKAWIANTPTDREKALNQLDGILLEGATDVASALEKLIQPGFEGWNPGPVNVFLLSDGQITWGESNTGALATRFENRCPFPTRFHCYHLGLGGDNQELFEALTRKGGAIFNCYGEDDVSAVARAHRKQCMQIESVRFEGGPVASETLVAGRKAAVYPDGEVIVGALENGPGPTKIILQGEYLGKKIIQEFPIEISGSGELAAHAWGELAVASLLALNDPGLDNLITAYCQQFSIASRVASFLVLENEADYKRLNLQEERGRSVPGGDLSRFLDGAWLAKVVSAREAFERFLAKATNRERFLDLASSSQIKNLMSALSDKDFETPDNSVKGAVLRNSDVPATYLAARDKDRRQVATYITESRRRADINDVDGAVRVLSSVVEEYPTRPDALRLVGYRLLDLKQPASANGLFGQVQHSRPFEPHSYRDLAHSLEESGRFGLAAINYEIVLAGRWHNRFRDSLKIVAQEEYAQMMQQALRQQAVDKKLADYFGQRLEKLGRSLTTGDLRVTISWNTDATDVDLWVIEPDGTKCYFQHTRTRNGGELSQDQTQGYGPERFIARKALPGTYRVLVHYYRANPNLLAGETHVTIDVTRFAGTPQEISERHTAILKKSDEQVEVCKVLVK